MLMLMVYYSLYVQIVLLIVWNTWKNETF